MLESTRPFIRESPATLDWREIALDPINDESEATRLKVRRFVKASLLFAFAHSPYVSGRSLRIPSTSPHIHLLSAQRSLTQFLMRASS
jgi:hypothetical protein